MTADQVRWKMNALIKKYKECIDNNSKSGRNPKTFEWFNQLNEIFGQQNFATVIHTVTSNFGNLKKLSSSSTQILDSSSEFSSVSTAVSNDANISLESSVNQNVQTTASNSNKIKDPTSNKRKRPLHGSGSNIAKAKIALENQWLEYMKTKVERDKVNDEKCAAALEQKREILKLKKQIFTLKEKESDQRKEYFAAKLREKVNRHAQQIAIEKEKCKFLKKLLKDKSSDSE